MTSGGVRVDRNAEDEDVKGLVTHINEAAASKMEKSVWS